LRVALSRWGGGGELNETLLHLQLESIKDIDFEFTVLSKGQLEILLFLPF